MTKSLLIDTDVLIDYLRNHSEAIKFIENNNDELFISAITVAELYAGVREGIERQKLDIFVSVFHIVFVDQSIAIRGGLYRRDYAKSHGVGLADAIIAATADAINATLVTLNHKHFPMLDTVYVPYQKS